MCEKKYIYIELNITADSVKIHIENTTASKMNSFKLLQLKQTEKINGIENMKSVVKKYNVMMETEVSNEVFCLDAILYNV